MKWFIVAKENGKENETGRAWTVRLREEGGLPEEVERLA